MPFTRRARSKCALEVRARACSAHGVRLPSRLSVRIPAEAVLAAAALGGFYTQLSPEQGKYPKLQFAFSVLVAIALACQLCCIFISTASSVALMSASAVSSPMAADVTSFLIREMEFQYLTVRLSFVTGLLCFIASIGVRSYVAFAPKPSLAKAVSLLTAAVFANLFAFFETTIAPYSSYFHMLTRTAVLYVTQFVPLQPLAGGLGLVFSCASLFFFCDAAIKHGRLKAD